MRSWPGYLPPAAAAVLTLLATGLFAAVHSTDDVVTPAMAVLSLMLIPVPFLLAALWGTALFLARPRRLVLAGALAWLVAALAFAPRLEVWHLAGYVGAGLAAGLVLALRTRLDVALALLVAVLAPMHVWTITQIPLQEQADFAAEQMLETLQLNLPDDATEAQRAEAVEQLRQAMEEVSRIAVRIYPGMLALGVIAQAGIILLLVWMAGRRLGFAGLGRKLGPFKEWRLPFYLVWVTIGGIGLLLTRTSPWGTVGLNALIVAGMLVSIQGLAIQVFVTARIMSPVMRLVFWVLMGLTPLLMLSCLVLGLVDQWLDIRRLQHRNETREGD